MRLQVLELIRLDDVISATIKHNKGVEVITFDDDATLHKYLLENSEHGHHQFGRAAGSGNQTLH